MSAIRPQQCPTYIHKTLATSPSSDKAERCEMHNIYRQPSHDGTDSAGAEGPGDGGANLPTAAGVHHQLGKVKVDTMPTGNIPGIHHRFHGNEAVPPRGEEATDYFGVQSSPSTRNNLRPRPSKASWPDDGNNSGSAPSPTEVQKSPEGKEQSIQEHPCSRSRQ